MIADSGGKLITFAVRTGTVQEVAAPEPSDAGQPSAVGLSQFFWEGIAVANRGLSMRKVREVLRLHHVAGLGGRAIARSLKISPVTVRRFFSRAEEQGLGWPLPESLDDAQLERRLAERIILRRLSVREAEAAAQGRRIRPTGILQQTPDDITSNADPDVRRLETALSETLGSTTRIDTKTGRLIIHYAGNLEILQGALERLGCGDA